MRSKLPLYLIALSLACRPGLPTSQVSDPVRVTARDVHQLVIERKGKVVVVNVWATWCEPCRKEFPAFLSEHERFAAKGLELLFVSADIPKELPELRKFLAAQNVQFQTYLKAQADSDFIRGLNSRWAGSLPMTMIFDRSGKMVEFWEGEIQMEDLAQKIEHRMGGHP